MRFLLVPYIQAFLISLVLAQIEDKLVGISSCASFLALWLLDGSFCSWDDCPLTLKEFHRISPLFPFLSDNYSEEEYESFSSEQEASDDAVQGQVLFRAWFLHVRASVEHIHSQLMIETKSLFL